MDNEIWKPVAGYEGLYKVSNKGNVFSLVSNKMLNKFLVNNYHRVSLYKDKKQKIKPVHRLVALNFIENPLNKPSVNHIDEDKLNNNVENLEWATHKENNNHGTRNKRASKSLTNGALSKKVIQLEYDYSFVKEWKSIHEADRKGYDKSSISGCCLKKWNTHRGYRWMFKKDFVEALAKQKGIEIK